MARLSGRVVRGGAPVAGATVFVQSVLEADDGTLYLSPRGSRGQTGPEGTLELMVPRASRYVVQGHDYAANRSLFREEWNEPEGGDAIRRDFEARGPGLPAR
jgi:hypothetical protein